MVKFPADDNVIDPSDKRPMDARIEAHVVNSRNIDDWLRTRFRYRAWDEQNRRFRQLPAIAYNEIPQEVHEIMEYIRENGGKKPDYANIHLVAEEQDDHGGIPVPNKDDHVLMDILGLLDNIHKNNLRRQGDGLNEVVRLYVANTILFRNIPEAELIAIWDKVDIRMTGTDLLDRQFFYATCREVIASFPMWKEISKLFTPIAYYLFTPNFLKLLTFLDNNQYVVDHRGNHNYYRRDWNGDVRISQQKTMAIFNNGLIEFCPLFKLVHFEYDKYGKCHLFFQKCGFSAREDGITDTIWANYRIARSISMCVSSLGWVSSSGIAPVMIQRDPATNEGFVDDKLTAGHVLAALSGHKYTDGDKHDNCNYRIVMDANGHWVYPGFDNLVPERDALLDNWAGLTQRLQGVGGDLIAADLPNDEEVAILEALINRIESRLR